MSCDHQFVIEHIDDYLEQALKPQLNKRFQHSCKTCSKCQNIVEQSQKLLQAANDWQIQKVVPWHRTEYVARSHQAASHWLSWSALATSSLAILMVLFQLNINYSANGQNIAFGDNQSQQIVEKMVQKQLAEYQQKQNYLFDQKMQLAIKQQDSIARLRLAEWLEKNRIERQQDIRFVMTGWQSQRYQDQQLVDRQLSFIADNQIENNQAINQLIDHVSQSKLEH
ncbi:MAG: hypothetical protein Q9M92_03495 [Enterobacterales bacterium]|nr:hypothetical protein [Enterobacterales bacterium]